MYRVRTVMMTGDGWRIPRGFWPLACLYCGAVLIVRLPLLYNAPALFEDDEAANALSIKHLVEGRSVLLFYYGQRYQGLTEGLVALPFVAVFGWEALAFMLSPLVAWTATVLLIGRWLWRRWGPEWSAGWFALQTFVPVFSLWSSTQALGGHVWVVLFAVASLYVADRGPFSPRQWCGFAALQLLGCYTYSYYALFLPVTWLAALRANHWRLRASLAATAVVIAAVGGVLALRAIAERVQSDPNCYPDFWRLDRQVMFDQIGDRWFVLHRQCLPLVFSTEGALHRFTRLNAALWLQAVGQAGFPALLEGPSRVLYALQLVVFTAAAIVAVARVVLRKEEGLFAEHVVLCGAAACVAFVLFRYGEQWSRVRYLTPVFPAATLSLLWCLRWLTRLPTDARTRWARSSVWAVVFIWIGYYAVVDVAYYRVHRMAGSFMTPRKITTFRSALVDWCNEQQLTGMLGYADYRLAYPVAFLTRERVRLCPYDLRRIPAYTNEAKGIVTPWFFGLELGPRGSPPEIGPTPLERFIELPCPPFRVVVWKPLAVLKESRKDAAE